MSDTLFDLLSAAARSRPDRGIAVFDARGRLQDRRSYPEVLEAAVRSASRLAATGLEPRDRVLISLPTSWELLDAWFGAVLLGAWPVAMAPTPMGASEIHAEKVAAITERIGARLLVTGDSLRQTIGSARREMRILTPPELENADRKPGFEPARVDPDETAFLQLTSGSTGVPSRGDDFPPGRDLQQQGEQRGDRSAPRRPGGPLGCESTVAWLPLNHDMGLVGCLWMSIELGFDLWLLRPTVFLARPRLWIEALAAHGPAYAPAPNFGYQLCVERIKPQELDGLDLSHWRAAMTGAEMIRPETVDAFCELTSRCGFKREAIRPCYGLAEGTLAVTVDLQAQGVRTRRIPDEAAAGSGLSDVVCVGAPVRDTRLRITAPDGNEVDTGRVGEVWVKSPGIFQGYYNDPEATAENLRDGWLCTGDLGFVADGELYLTGRVKDLLIIRGTNIMPHELEWLAESVAGGGGSHRCGAFSVARDAQGEQAVLVVETTEKDGERLAEMGHEIRRRVGDALSLTLADLLFMRRGRMPKTTSGKVQRKELRRRYLAGELERLPL